MTTNGGARISEATGGICSAHASDRVFRGSTSSRKGAQSRAVLCLSRPVRLSGKVPDRHDPTRLLRCVSLWDEGANRRDRGAAILASAAGALSAPTSHTSYIAAG